MLDHIQPCITEIILQWIEIRFYIFKKNPSPHLQTTVVQFFYVFFFFFFLGGGFWVQCNNALEQKKHS